MDRTIAAFCRLLSGWLNGLAKKAPIGSRTRTTLYDKGLIWETHARFFAGETTLAGRARTVKLTRDGISWRRQQWRRSVLNKLLRGEVGL